MRRNYVITVQYSSGCVEYYKAADERHRDRMVRNFSEMPTVELVKTSEARK